MNSEHDYIAAVKQRNKKLFNTGKQLQMKPEEFERQIRLAFLAGKQSGRNEKSLFEQVFGP